jgi:hypothetical protein
MAHWLDTFPHKICASVILKNNKIKFWKVGENPLKDKYNIPALEKEHPEYSYKEQYFEVNNKFEHNVVFEVEAVEWFRQWDLHEDFKGSSPFVQEKFEGLIGGRYQIISPIKTGN